MPVGGRGLSALSNSCFSVSMVVTLSGTALCVNRFFNNVCAGVAPYSMVTVTALKDV